MGQPYETTLHLPIATSMKPNTLTIASLLSISLLAPKSLLALPNAPEYSTFP